MISYDEPLLTSHKDVYAGSRGAIDDSSDVLVETAVVPRVICLAVGQY